MKKYTIPISVVIAGIIVAGAVIFTGGGSGDGGNTSGGEHFGNNNSPSAEGIRAVENDEHIRGDLDAKVSIIEFSDFQCPFCQRMHPTLSRIIDEFPGEVRWVYRHFPLTQIHPQALSAAVASECVADLAGNDAFWEFADALFGNQGALSANFYTSLAGELGISESDFTSCVGSRNTARAVQTDLDDAFASGGRGTPYSVVINKDGDVFPFSGAIPYEQVRSIVEGAINS